MPVPSPVNSLECDYKISADYLKPDSHGHPPSSPRTRIRTIAAKDYIHR